MKFGVRTLAFILFCSMWVAVMPASAVAPRGGKKPTTTAQVPVQSPTASVPAVTATFTVKLVAGLTADEQAAVVIRNGGTEKVSIPALRLHVITVPVNQLQISLKDYAADPQVESVESDKVRKREGIPNDSDYGVQWALGKIGWDKVFCVSVPAGKSKVAILDSGIDSGHRDLLNSVVPGISFIDGGNGLSDSVGHGTQMAGVIAAVTDNGAGIAGVAFAGTSIVPVTVLDSNGNGSDSDIIQGIVWAADNGADVIVMGFSSPDYSQHLQDALDYAWEKGAVLVAAAGNSGSTVPAFPAGARGVIGVSATDENDMITSFSNTGEAVFIAAPGSNIYTTLLDNSYDYVSGTSMASAIVGGVAAFMKVTTPSLTNGIIAARLALSAEEAVVSSGADGKSLFGNGRINIEKALANQSTDSIQPAGASPVGTGGPYMGVYSKSAYTIPVVAAVPSANQGITSYRNSFPVAVNFTASEPVTIYYTTNGATPSTTSNSIAVNSAGGYSQSISLTVNPTVLKFYGKSATVSTSVQTVNYVLDTTPPVTSASPAGSTTGRLNSTANVYLTANKPATIYYTTNGAEPSVSSSASFYDGVGNTSKGPISLSTDTVMKFFAVDLAGNQEAVRTQTYLFNKSQSITFNPLAVRTYGDSEFSLDATATSGLPVNYSSSDPTVATISGTKVTILKAGRTVITASQVGDDNFMAASNVEQSLTVEKAIAKVSLWPLAEAITYGQTLAFSSLSGGNGSTAGSFSFMSPSSAPGAGSYVADVIFAPADPANYTSVIGAVTVTVKKASGKITLTGLSQTYDSNPKTVSATTVPAGLAVEITYNGSTTTPVNAGSYAVAAVINDVNFEGSASTAMEIGKALSTVSVWPNAGSITYGQSLSTSVLTGGKGTPFGTFSFSIPETVPDAGSFNADVKFLPADTINYNPVNGTVSVTVNKAAAKVMLNNLSQTYSGAPKTAEVTTIPVGLAVSITYNGGASAPVNAGSYPVAATVTDSNYEGSVNGNLIINKAPSTVSLWPTAKTISFGQTLSSSTLSGGSGAPSGSFSFAAPGTAPNAGTYSAQAVYTPVDTNNYNSLNGTIPVTVNKAAATVMLSGLSQTYSGVPKVVTASTSPVGLAVTVTYNGSVTAPINAGSFSVTGSVNDANYDGSASGTLLIAKSGQAITIVTPAPATAAINSKFTVAATSASGLAVVYSSGSPAVCTNSGAVFTMISSTGICNVRYDQAGDGNYNAAAQLNSNTTATAAGKVSQTITVTTTAPVTAPYKGTFTVAAVASSGLPVSYSSGSPLICSNRGSLFTMLNGTGTCIVNYNQSGDSTRSAAPTVSSNTTATKIGQVITITKAAPTVATRGSKFSVSAKASSGYAVAYSSGTPSVCTVSNGSTFTMISSGTCVVRYNQAGNSNYTAALQLTSTTTVR